jgi:hypothetical protein
LTQHEINQLSRENTEISSATLMNHDDENDSEFDDERLTNLIHNADLLLHNINKQQQIHPTNNQLNDNNAISSNYSNLPVNLSQLLFNHTPLNDTHNFPQGLDQHQLLNGS